MIRRSPPSNPQRSSSPLSLFFSLFRSLFRSSLLIAIFLSPFLLPLPAATAQSLSPHALLLQDEALVGQEIIFEIYGSPEGLRIQSPTQIYRYLGSPESSVAFTPAETGSHLFLLTRADGSVIFELPFTVLSPLPLSSSEVPSSSSPVSSPSSSDPSSELSPRSVRGPKGTSRGVSSRILDQNANGRATIEIIPDDALFERLTLRNASPKNLSIGFDRPPKSEMRLAKKSIMATYAIDPTTADFTEGELVKVAEGSELHKCAAWNFDERRCDGSWVKLRDLIPGEEYTIPITPDDPGFAETGVATINSVKPIYEPGETADLLIAVLDTEGYLVPGAAVDLEIRRPDNLTIFKSTGNNSISEISLGIYRAKTSDTALEGEYELFVSALAAGVNMTMRSSFDVQQEYLYDILRETPMSIDPWQGPFESVITVRNHDANAALVTVTERLPLGLAVTDTGNATLMSTNESQFLTWMLITPGTPLTYAVQAPYYSPDLYTLGEIVVSSLAGEQVEARPWHVAIDPSNTLLPIVHVNTEVGGTDLTVGEVADISSDNTAYVTFTKNVVLTTEVSDPTNATPINGVSSLSCAVTYTSQGYSPAATFRVDDAFGANQLGATTLPASVGVDNTVTLSNLQADPDFNIGDLFTLNVYISNNDGGGPQTISVDYVRCSVTYTEADIASPAVTLSAPEPDAYLPSANVNFTFTPSDNVALDECRLYVDETLNQTLSSPVNGSINTIVSTISEGAHNWTVNCNDTSNNVGWASPVRDFTIDLTAPAAFTLSSPANDTVSTDLVPTMTWQATTETNFQNYTLILDNDPGFGSPNYVRNTYNSVTNTSFTFSTIIASNTKYYWKVIAYDRAGWSRTSTGTWAYTTDTVLPSTFTLVAPSTGAVTANRIPFLDWGSTVETNFKNYTVQFDNDAAFTSIDHSYYAFNLVSNSSYQVQGGEELGPDTLWYWRVIAYDRAGQSRASTATFNYTTDNSGPMISLLFPSPGYDELVTNSLQFNYSVTDTLSAVASCSLIINGTVEQTQLSVPEGSTRTFDQYLANGAYEWWINCTDGVGNINESAHRFLTVTVTVDTTPPVITPHYPAPNAYLNASTVIFNYTVQDATGIENCSIYIDGTLNQTNGSVANNGFNYFTVLGFSEAQHSWFISCTDNSTSYNNANSSSRNFTIDVTLPTIFDLLEPANDTRTNNPIMFLDWSQTTETNFKNYTILLDNDSDFSSPEYAYARTAIGQTNHTSGSLADNWYYWKAIAYDLAGNARMSTQTWQFQIHTGLPVITDVTETPSGPVEYNPGRVYNFTVIVDEPELDAVLFQHNFFGSPQNFSPTGGNGTTFYYQIVGLNAGNYQYKWYANDTLGNVNETATYTYNVTKNVTTMTLTLDGTSSNLITNESTIVNLTGALDWPSTGQVQIRENGSLLMQNMTPATVLRNFLIPGLFSINASYAGSANYYSSWQAWNVTVLDIYAPNVTLFTPYNASTDLDGVVAYAYEVSDTNNVINCTLYVDGSANGTMSSITKETTLYFNREYAVSQNVTWQVRCVDAAGHEGNSSIYNLTIEINEFTRNLVPYLCSDANGCTAANINATGTYEDHGILLKSPRDNYVYANLTLAAIPLGATILNVSIAWEKYQSTLEGTFFLSWRNGSNWDPICSQAFTASSTVSPDNLYCDFTTFPTLTTFNDGLDLRANFYYAGNPSGNTFGTDYVEVAVTYQEDETPPTISLNEPPDAQERGAGDIVFNFTPSDLNLENCTLYGDFNGPWAANQTIDLAGGLTSGAQNSFSPVYLDPGYYTWNVLCYDIANNFAFAATNYSVNITPPDLVSYTQYITWDILNPVEGQTVMLNATVFNDGFTTAVDFLIQFWKGDPDVAGVQIGDNLSIASLAGFANTSVNTTYVVGPGPNRIFLLIDPDNRIAEASESNNKVNRTLHVDAYNVFLGSVRANITLDNQGNNTLRLFNMVNITGNLFFVRSGTSLDFTALQALGKTTADLPTSNDFTEADALLNMSDFNDSVNARWANNTDTPVFTRTFTVFDTSLTDVPIINSESSGNFSTGILWDTSKDNSSNTEYDATDKEPIVFVTELNQGSSSDYGLTDYVVDIPAYLRAYGGQPPTTVTIYYEIW